MTGLPLLVRSHVHDLDAIRTLDEIVRLAGRELGRLGQRIAGAGPRRHTATEIAATVIETHPNQRSRGLLHLVR
jgi:hypothetical protein